MKKMFIALFLSLAGFNSLASAEQNTASYLMTLKPRQPNWRFEVIKTFPQGNPQVIVFYEPIREGERAVKQVVFHENSRIMSEMDIILNGVK